MIRLGLTSFNEHDKLTGKKRSTLYEYAGYLPLVEMDTAYYGIPKQDSVREWTKSVPENFRFVMKVYSGISCQGEWQQYYQSEEEMVEAFLTSMAPMIESGKLFAFLIQFSGTFSCTKENVQYLEKIRRWFTGCPIAIELRNGSWYTAKYIKQTLSFMKHNEFSLVAVDEPQIPTNPVPFFPYVTNDHFALFRFHGRNAAGWMANDKDWRKKRTLYRYNTEEIAELSEAVEKVAREAKEIGVIFNNNSGGDAAGNLLEMKAALNLEYDNLNPKQMDLF
ncbi:DUF72 domain-containing protein [Enterococcus caccae]|uniref:DUF72 domain-containing protein n=1 Tax=Enterococcus caccae ATCC BAA-1240 TaxID=1158612 RepID=R3U5V0_9ENTE|nr:DUF72 domain-containing protein [Enterococcus caccae]EOL49324.1 hypothetical protein UC7_00701 [Enterococcus caccae ATCC BAA-1240]EOT56376.1 hypothetical protein I580_03176 [Enterococcus caccae ATCC BAA-1240]OJG24287.1 hypothetical protein RU98_GL001710 [Enterococcus caccae]